MNDINFLKNTSFLKALDAENIKVYYVKILILDKNELPIRSIEGRFKNGNISINGSSSVRRAGSLAFVAEEENNDLTNIDNLLSINKKIKILIGIENNIDKRYDNIIWFNQGIFIITQPSLQHTLNNGVLITLQFKDKMSLLNGDCGGGLPSSITFHEYDQIIGYDDNGGKGYTKYPLTPNNYTVYFINNEYMMWSPAEGWNIVSKDLVGNVTSIPQRIFDIIQTLVCNFGNEAISNIIINDVPLQLKASVRYTGTETLYYNTKTSVYTLNEEEATTNPGNWITFSYNEDCGYIYTDFTYPGTLISSIGDNICSVLDKIIGVLGNYEYFYDIEGKFIFQEKKNYLNTSYDPVQKLDKNGFLIDSSNYFIDFSNTSKSVYTFEEGSALISSYANTPNYMNIKNDYHIWGKNEQNLAIHYHLAIKDKPQEPFGTWLVVDEVDDDGRYTGKIHLAQGEEIGYSYVPTDWRAELYLRGCQKKILQQRPDIYEQELLDLFDSIYNMREKCFKVDIINHPNDLLYWMDYINPSLLYDISIDTIGIKMKTEQRDNIIKIYNSDIPDVIMIDSNASPLSQASIIYNCENMGQPYSRVPQSVYSNIAVGTVGYTAQETMRNLLYQYTDYNSTITIQSIPIYYLDVNSRITIQDKASGISGDYIINSISLPLEPKSNMTISASKVLSRV